MFLGGLVYWCCAPGTPLARPKSKIYTPKRDNNHSRLFHVGVSPTPPGLGHVSRMENNRPVKSLWYGELSEGNHLVGHPKLIDINTILCKSALIVLINEKSKIKN